MKKSDEERMVHAATMGVIGEHRSRRCSNPPVRRERRPNRGRRKSANAPSSRCRLPRIGQGRVPNGPWTDGKLEIRDYRDEQVSHVSCRSLVLHECLCACPSAITNPNANGTDPFGALCD